MIINPAKELKFVFFFIRNIKMDERVLKIKICFKQSFFFILSENVCINFEILSKDF